MNRSQQQAWLAAGAATQLAFVTGSCALVGYMADRWLGTTPALLIGSLILGFFIGIGLLFRVVSRFQDDDDEPDDDRP